MTCTAPLREEEVTETVYVSVLLQSPACHYHTVLQVQVGNLSRVAVGDLLYRDEDSVSDAPSPDVTGLIAVAVAASFLVVIVISVAIFMCLRLEMKKKTKEEKQGR